jgi:streptomycin 6-kinase
VSGSFPISDRLRAACSGAPERVAWAEHLPRSVAAARVRWSLTLGQPFPGESCAWVAPAVNADGDAVVLKLGMPHMEAEQEAAGLRFLAGEPTVRLLDAHEELGAMLLERCEPGRSLRERPEEEQDGVIAGLLRRLWRVPPPGHFRPLGVMCAFWADETRRQASHWPDAGLVRAGLELLEGLPRSATEEVLLATDLHAGNVLSARREPWLVIDPKPFLGDPAYDATQHLLNCRGRLRADPAGTIERFAGLLDLPAERVRLWMFARAAAEPRDDWSDLTLARSLAP